MMAESFWRHWRPALIATVILVGFAVLGASLVGLGYENTAQQIAENERLALLRQLNSIIPPGRYDNDLLQDTIIVKAPKALGSEATRVYRARNKGNALAIIFSPVIARGYNGSIKLLVGIYADGRLAGVRVISHRETPGLGDKIEIQRHPWIDSFSGKSLQQPSEQGWKVKRDGGDFDQFTGATITPRAVVAAVKQSLQYFAQNQNLLLTENKP
jgi:electron transport complex protein RnfG